MPKVIDWKKSFEKNTLERGKTYYTKNRVAKVIETREKTKRELHRLGFTFRDSMTNFIFATHDRVPAQVIFEKLREMHIFVRHFQAPRIDNYLRISIGTNDEMKRFLDAVQEIVGSY